MIARKKRCTGIGELATKGSNKCKLTLGGRYVPELAPLLSVAASASLSLAGVVAVPPLPVGVSVALVELLLGAFVDDEAVPSGR